MWCRVTKWIFACWLAKLCSARSGSRVDAQRRIADFEIHGSVQSFYADQQLLPCAVLRADLIHVDYERKGFFRIGALPLLAVEARFQFEVRNPDLAATSFAKLQDWVMSQSHGTSRLELRQPVFVINALSTNRLECGRARAGRDGKWELLDGVSLCAGTSRVHVERAFLQMNGADAGRIMLKRPSVARLSISFQPTSIRNYSRKENPNESQTTLHLICTAVGLGIQFPGADGFQLHRPGTGLLFGREQPGFAANLSFSNALVLSPSRFDRHQRVLYAATLSIADSTITTGGQQFSDTLGCANCWAKYL